MGRDVAAALALVLVIEGILPFASPSTWRRAVRTMEQLKDGQLRAGGLASMLFGLLLLFFVNH